MYETAMVITVVSAIYLAAWSLHSHDKMSGVIASVLAIIAATVIVLELTIYMVVLLPILHWAISAAVFTATAILFVTCLLARINRPRNLLQEDKKPADR